MFVQEATGDREEWHPRRVGRRRDDHVARLDAVKVVRTEDDPGRAPRLFPPTHQFPGGRARVGGKRLPSKRTAGKRFAGLAELPGRRDRGLPVLLLGPTLGHEPHGGPSGETSRPGTSSRRR